MSNSLGPSLTWNTSPFIPIRRAPATFRCASSRNNMSPVSTPVYRALDTASRLVFSRSRISAMRSSSEFRPSSRLRSSTPFGSWMGNEMGQPSGSWSNWVPYICISPDMVSNLSVRNASCHPSASSSLTATSNRSAQWDMKSVSVTACCAISHAACAASCPTLEMVGQPTLSIISSSALAFPSCISRRLGW